MNFKLEDLEAVTDDLDYLSAVRGLWWSYFGGPAVSKVRTGVQILLGLPFSEEEGIIQVLILNHIFVFCNLIDWGLNFSIDKGLFNEKSESTCLLKYCTG